MKYVSVDEYLMGRAKLEDLPPEYITNLNSLLPKVNALLKAFGEYRAVNSGFRTPEINAHIQNAAKKSKHMICAAVDLEDKNGKLKAFCSVDILKKYDLYMENGNYTKNWCHLQSIAPRSGNRIFIP